MIIILGLIILVAAVVIGMAGVAANAGSAHALTHPFAVFGYHVTGSTGTLLLSGIIIGAAGMLGLGLLLAGARRTSLRGSAARADLEQSRRERGAPGAGHDEVTGQRQTTPAPTSATAPAAGPARTAAAADSSGDNRQSAPDDHRRWLHPFGHRPAPH